MAPQSSTLAWKIPWMEEPGGLQSMGSLRVGHDWATSLSLFHFHTLEKEMATHSSVLAWRIPGAGEPGGLTSIGSYRVGHHWSDLAAVATAAMLLVFGLFYKIVISCITKCVNKPLIKMMTRQLEHIIYLRAIHVYIYLWTHDCNSIALNMGRSNTGYFAWTETDLKDMWSKDFWLLLSIA